MLGNLKSAKGCVALSERVLAVAGEVPAATTNLSKSGLASGSVGTALTR